MFNIETDQICEWKIHEELPFNIQGRAKIRNWIVENYTVFFKAIYSK